MQWLPPSPSDRFLSLVTPRSRVWLEPSPVRGHPALWGHTGVCILILAIFIIIMAVFISHGGCHKLLLILWLTTNLVFSCVRSQKSGMGVAQLISRCWQGYVLSGSFRENLFLVFPIFQGHPHFVVSWLSSILKASSISRRNLSLTGALTLLLPCFVVRTVAIRLGSIG